MVPQQFTVRAKFDGSRLVVIDRSFELPEPSEGQTLLLYLTILSADGWIAVSGQFVGWEVILYVEQHSEVPYKTGYAYLTPILYQFPYPAGLTTAATQHIQLIDQIQEIGEKEGWQKLAGPKQYDIGGLWTISIWAKPYPLS